MFTIRYVLLKAVLIFFFDASVKSRKRLIDIGVIANIIPVNSLQVVNEILWTEVAQSSHGS